MKQNSHVGRKAGPLTISAQNPRSTTARGGLFATVALTLGVTFMIAVWVALKLHRG
jgi:hypothetical protein